MNIQELKRRMVLRSREGLASYSQMGEFTNGMVDCFELAAFFNIDLLKELCTSTNHQVLLKIKKLDVDHIVSPMAKKYLESQYEKARKKQNTNLTFPVWIEHNQTALINKLKLMMRKNRESIRETGADCLRIGLPYLFGKFMDENNDADVYRAPIFLLSVEIGVNKTQGGITLTLKEDIELNSVLFEKLAYYGEAQISEETIEEMREAYSELYHSKKPDRAYVFFISKTWSILADLTYNKLQLPVTNVKYSTLLELTAPMEHKQLSKPEVVKYLKDDTTQFIPSTTLGFFRLNSQEIINDLNSWKDGDAYLEELSRLELELFEKPVPDYQESDLIQICDLDNSQKYAVLKALNESSVIYGPPGTGKSQTIANLLANVIKNRKTALFCAEKRVATDVVYQRLANFKAFTLIIHDLYKDRREFYMQLRANLEQLRIWYNERNQFNNHIKQLNREIDEIFAQVANYKGLLETNEGQLYLRCLKKYPLPQTYSSEVRRFMKISDVFNISDYQQVRGLYEQIMEWRELYKVYQQIPHEFDLVLDHLGYLDQLSTFDWQGCVDRQMSVAYFLKSHKLRQKLNFFNRLNLVNYKLKTWDNLTEQITYLRTNKKQLSRLVALTQNDRLAILQALRSYSDDQIAILLEQCFVVAFESNHQTALLQENDGWQLRLQELLAQKTTLSQQMAPAIIGASIMEQLNQDCQKDEAFRGRYNMFYKTITQNQRFRSIKFFCDKFGDIIARVCPVLIASLEVGASLLPLKREVIDYAIFDEASQIYLEKGVTLLYRAKITVVAGDEHQLQPTNFFIKDLEDNNEEAYLDNDGLYQAGEFVSLLNFAKHIYNDYQLNYHYRAKFIELIQFSNANFYNYQLLACNSSDRPKSSLPIELIRAEGIWDNQVNELEAIRVVELVQQVLKTRKHKESIGIITFNKKQAELIQTKLASLAVKNPALDREMNRYEALLDESLFVKNLEEVQGEERDIIIFSTAFAYSKKGSFNRNFGPINKLNGEFRINVAVSRARTKIYLVTSIMSSDILRDANISNGAKVFGNYLKYCELLQTNALDSAIMSNWVQPQDQESTLGVNNLFSDQVKQALEQVLSSKQYEIQQNLTQIGLNVDLAIWDKNQQKYVLAIECDSYIPEHKLPAKTRDYYRFAMLKAKGWNVERISALSWFHSDQQEIINHLVKKIK